jgi:hypothetical protein
LDRASARRWWRAVSWEQVEQSERCGSARVGPHPPSLSLRQVESARPLPNEIMRALDAEN